MIACESDHAAFRRAIRDNPRDPLPHEIYADYLGECGDSEGERRERDTAASLRADIARRQRENADPTFALRNPAVRAASLRGGIKRLITNAKTIRAVKAILIAREARREARRIADAARTRTGDRFGVTYRAKVRARAVAIGRKYHDSIKSLYVSKWGDILYGRGGQETADYERYSKGYHRNFGAARNLNGGARVDDETRPTVVILENHRGTEVARVPYTRS